MDRRSFLGLMVAVSGRLMLRGFAFGESLAPATRPASSSEQTEATRAAAEQFLKSLRQVGVIGLFLRSKGQSPIAAKFSRSGGMGGDPRGRGGPGAAFQAVPILDCLTMARTTGAGPTEARSGAAGLAEDHSAAL